MADEFDARIVAAPTGATRIITLEVDPAYHFRAGQYLNVVAADGTFIPLSIASSPTRLPELELHYRSTPGLPEAAAMDALLDGSVLKVTAAQGDVRAGAPHQPALMVTGGTGAAQAFSCAQYRAATGADGATTIVWCADSDDQLYATERLSALPNVTLHTLVDDRRTPANEGLVWLRENGGSFAASEHAKEDTYVLLAGGPAFVYAAFDALLNAGVTEAQCHADVFTYAPRH